jgi:hypothetical protein
LSSSNHNYNGNDYGNRAQTTLKEWRKNKALELSAMGLNYTEISEVLKQDPSTISKLFKRLRKEAKEAVKEYLDEKLPLEYQKCIVAIEAVSKQAWAISNRQGIDPKTELLALSLAKDCVKEKMDLLTNAEVINGAVRFVSSAETRLAAINNLPKSETKPLTGLDSLEESASSKDNDSKGTQENPKPEARDPNAVF